MDARAAEDTASLAQKYTTECKYYGRFNDYSDVEFGFGGCQRAAGEIPRAAFEGARTLTKATRTLWLVAIVFTTAMPFPSFQKPQQIRLLDSARDEKCQQSRTPTVYH
jgi:hypothetical protein